MIVEVLCKIMLIFSSLHSYNSLCQRGSVLVLVIRLIRLYSEALLESSNIALYVNSRTKFNSCWTCKRAVSLTRGGRGRSVIKDCSIKCANIRLGSNSSFHKQFLQLATLDPSRSNLMLPSVWQRTVDTSYRNTKVSIFARLLANIIEKPFIWFCRSMRFGFCVGHSAFSMFLSTPKNKRVENVTKFVRLSKTTPRWHTSCQQSKSSRRLLF